MQDSLSTAPDKAAPLWVQPELIGPDGATPLSALKPLDSLRTARRRLAAHDRRRSGERLPALRVKLSSVLVYDIAGKGFTRFQGATGLEAVPLTQGESVQARFFVFDQQPSMDRLVPPNPETPLPRGSALQDGLPRRWTASTGMHWAARRPSPGTPRRGSRPARSARPRKPSADGLADLLWAVMMTPEFQLIR